MDTQGRIKYFLLCPATRKIGEYWSYRVVTPGEDVRGFVLNYVSPSKSVTWIKIVSLIFNITVIITSVYVIREC